MITIKAIELIKGSIFMALLLCMTGSLDAQPSASHEVKNEDKRGAKNDQQLKAFPGAEGFGAYSKGGRGGKVLYVTNLNNDGKGSLRWAVEKEEPRTVVFQVSGTIKLEADLSIENPFITIAGQTAPGDGICVRDHSLEIETHDVIVRYIRARLGDEDDVGDAISIKDGNNIIVDHCSASWGTDEILSASTRDPDLTDVTVQWCFITEALNPVGHGYGSLIRGTGGARYSFLHNLYAHNHGRNPRPGNYNTNPHDEDPEGLLLDFRNNVIYNWGGEHAGYNADEKSVLRLNYVGNYLIPGTNSVNNGIAYKTGSPYNKGYFHNNYYDNKKPENQWELVNFEAEGWSKKQIEAFKQNQPFPTGPIDTNEPHWSYEKVLAEGGASLPNRDKVDARVVRDVRNRTGAIINSQKEVGGWPELDSASAPEDSDKDGMPDAWEKQNGLDPNDAEDRNQKTEKGYTMLEKYLNSLVK